MTTIPTPADLLGIGDRLLEIDEQRFRQVVGLLEHMGDHPDVQKTFSLIRPRLAELRPKRRPTLKRLFCDPFEDLFEPATAGGKPPVDTISRNIVNHLWPHVESRLGGDAIAGFAARLRHAEESPASMGALENEFWAVSAEAVADIHGQLEAGRLDGPMELRLSSERIACVQRVAEALAIAPLMRTLKQVLAPHPLAKLHQDHLDGLQEVGRVVARTRPQAMKVFVLVAASRLSDPAMLLGSLWTMDFGQKSSDRASLFVELSGSVVSQMEERARALRSAEAGSADRLSVADLAVDLVASLDATRSAMEASRRSEFDQRLREVRSAVHEMVRTQVLDGAQTGILATIGTEAGGSRDGIRQGENHARALRKCAGIADSLGLRTQIKAVVDDTVTSLTGAAQDMLGSAGASADPRAGYAAIRMIELVAGPVEANRILSDILARTRPL